MEKGSMIVLAIMATLILSIILMAGLTVSTTEAQTTQNYYLNKVSYYKAVEGVEIATEDIRNENDPTLISQFKYMADGNNSSERGVDALFISGSLVNLQAGNTQNISLFMGFDAPPLPGISLGGGVTGVSSVIWYVPITSQVTVNNKRAFTEIEAGIYSILLTGY
jgi:hypothetical protein